MHTRSPASVLAALVATAGTLAGCSPSGGGDTAPARSAPPPANTPLFADVTTASGMAFESFPRHDIAGYGQGAAVADIDGDGDLDVYLTQDRGACALYRNDGAWTFTEVAAAAGVSCGDNAHAKGAAFLDYDRDGDLDLAVGTAGLGNRLFRNRGDGTFDDVSDTSGLGGGDAFTMSFVPGDFDNDGWTDLYECNGIRTNYPVPDAYDPRPAANRLWKNNGDGTFTDVAPALGLDDPVFTWAAHWVDLDRDGALDLVVANDIYFTYFYPYTPIVDRVWISSGPPDYTFTDHAGEYGMDERHNGMGIAVGDLDGDRRFDVYVTDMGPNELRLTGDRRPWPDRAPSLGVTEGWNNLELPIISWGAAIRDFDQDGRSDLLVVNGTLSSVDPSSAAESRQDMRLFLARNDGSGGLALHDTSDASGLLGVHTIGARAGIPADLDGDGDLDLVVATRVGPARLLRNDTPRVSRWYGVRLAGTASEPDGLGAELELLGPGGRVLACEPMTAGGQPHSSLPFERIFTPGPGRDGRLHVRVRWPSGRVQRAGLEPDAWTTVVEAD